MADFQPPPTWALPVEADKATGIYSFSPVWLKWFLDLVAILNASGGSSGILHNQLTDLQGGQSNQYFHLNNANYTDLTDAGYTTLHKHADSYGEMYADMVSYVVTISASGTAYEIDGGFTGGTLSGTTFPNDHYLQVSSAGVWFGTWSISFYGTANNDIEGGFMVNGAAQTNGTSHAEAPTTNKAANMSAAGILNLALNDQVSLFVENHSAANNVTIMHATLVLIKLI